MRRIYVLVLFLAIVVLGGSPQLLAADNVKVGLVLKDFSTCTNDDVAEYAEANPDLVHGFVNVHFEEAGKLLLIVHLKYGTPNTEYQVSVKCVNTFEERLYTNPEGVGNAIYRVPPEWAVGPVFAIDMYPEGAPLGNKYQSVQVDLTE
jgi:hypothetical protein